MPLSHIVIGIIVMLLAFSVMLLMVIKSINTIIEDEAQKQAEELAEQMIESAQYRVRFGVRFVNETRR